MNAFFIFITLINGCIGDSVRGAVTMRFADGNLYYSFSVCSTADEFSREAALALAEGNQEFCIKRVPDPETLPKEARGFVWVNIRRNIMEQMEKQFAFDEALCMKLVRKIYPTPSLRMNRLSPETQVRIEAYVPPPPKKKKDAGAPLEGQRTFRERKYSHLLKEGAIAKPTRPKKPRAPWSDDQIEAARNSKYNGN